MKKISIIKGNTLQLPTTKRVAAYARISEETERLSHSLSAQVSYYSKLIQDTPGWDYVGVYADNGISGTKTETRAEFNRLIQDCNDGKIDIVLTKSISRFARNTVDLLKTVRHLKDIGISVRFEKEHIDSLTEDGELMLTLLASFAQEESRSISENIKWSTRKRFEKGIPNGHFVIFGYRWVGEKLVIVPEEAEIVRLIYSDFLNGISAESTEKKLAEMGVKSFKGGHFGNSSIRHILHNITYTGNLLLQKEYVADPISKKNKINRGELPQYWIENSHEPIISMETFKAVQEERERRRSLGVLANWSINTSCFTSKIKCGYCGSSFVKSVRRNRLKHPMPYDPDKVVSYSCGTKKKKGGRCPAKDIPEKILYAKINEALGIDVFDETLFSEEIERIDVPSNGRLIFRFYDGRTFETTWESTAKKDAWTPERRQLKSQYMLEHHISANSTAFTGIIRCENCGVNYRRESHKSVSGEKISRWRCSGSKDCTNNSIEEKALKNLSAQVLHLPEFDEEVFKEKVSYIGVVGVGKLVFHFKDGQTVEAQWENKIQGTPHTEEYKKAQSQKMKEYWRKKHAESKNDTSDNQPIHG